MSLGYSWDQTWLGKKNKWRTIDVLCFTVKYFSIYRALAVTWPILFTPPCWQARTAGSEYEMNGASISFKATEFTAHFNSKDIDMYIAKLNRLNITDPYNVPGVLLTCINIWTDRFPDLQYPDMSQIADQHWINIESMLMHQSNYHWINVEV